MVLGVDWSCNSRTSFFFQYGMVLKAICGVGEAIREYSAARWGLKMALFRMGNDSVSAVMKKQQDGGF